VLMHAGLWTGSDCAA